MVVARSMSESQCMAGSASHMFILVRWVCSRHCWMLMRPIPHCLSYSTWSDVFGGSRYFCLMIFHILRLIVSMCVFVMGMSCS